MKATVDKEARNVIFDCGSVQVSMSFTEFRALWHNGLIDAINVVVTIPRENAPGRATDRELDLTPPSPPLNKE